MAANENARAGIEDWLGALGNVRAAGPDRWRARCPAHNSEGGNSLSLRELPDGKVLAYCFGGCAYEAVRAAAGLERPARYHNDQGSPVRPRVRPSDALAALLDDAMLVLVVAEDLLREIPPDERTKRLLTDAVARIWAAYRGPQL